MKYTQLTTKSIYLKSRSRVSKTIHRIFNNNDDDNDNLIMIMIIIMIMVRRRRRRRRRRTTTTTTTTTITIMVGKMVSQDCHPGKGNLSMAWVDVKKAYDYPLITSD